MLAGGGSVFPEPGHENGKRLDDAAGYAALLIVREDCAVSRAFADAGGFVVRVAALPDAQGRLAALMGGAAALLIRPDRYVFGTGDAAALTAAWQTYLAMGSVEAAPAAA